MPLIFFKINIKLRGMIDLQYGVSRVQQSNSVINIHIFILF